jgi:hypothetical protein
MSKEDPEDGSLPYLDGWDAHRAGLSNTVNPYHERLQSRSHDAWIRGWSDRFSYQKHGLPLTFDQ